MGVSSDKKKYMNAYRSIKYAIGQTYNITTTVNDIYFVNEETIQNYLKILNKHNILNMLIDVRKRSELKNIEDKIYDDFGDYKLEPNIEVFEINAQKIREGKLDDKKFILVDKDFLKNMSVNEKKYKGKEHSIIVKKNEKHIELKGIDEEKIIVNLIEFENKTGIYKFKIEESIDYNGESIAEDVKKEIKPKDEDEENPEVILFRTKPKNYRDEEPKKNITDQDKTEHTQKVNEETKKKDGDTQDNQINNGNPPKTNEIITKKAPSAKLDDIVYEIYSALSNNGEKDIIFEKIKLKISELDIQNELEETGIDIIGNIKKFVLHLAKNSSLKNQNLININQSENLNYYYQESNLIDESDEKSNLIESRNEGDIHSDNNKDFNPFEFRQVKFIDCKKCNIKENQEYLIEFYKININNECNNIDDYFKLSFIEICSNCKKNAICNYKFKTAPEILILKFENPKINKKYIKFNEIQKNIDLKNHMYLPNNFNIKYELIEVLYVLDDLDDKKLYVGISEKDRNNYIPYIIFYKKINDM